MGDGERDDEASPGSDRPARGERSRWTEDVPGTESGDPASEVVEHLGGSEPRQQDDDSAEEVAEPELVEEADRLIPLIVARLDQHQHLHLPIQVPDPDALAELKQKDPLAHKTWLKQVSRQMEHQRFMESAKYRMPLKTIRSAQLAVLVALMSVLGFAGYAVHEGHSWIGAFLGTVDIAAILTVFTDIGRRERDEDE